MNFRVAAGAEELGAEKQLNPLRRIIGHNHDSVARHNAERQEVVGRLVSPSLKRAVAQPFYLQKGSDGDCGPFVMSAEPGDKVAEMPTAHCAIL
jgi:hypothetical protein